MKDTQAHRHTPSVIATDSRGLPVRQVAYLRAIADAPVETLITRLRHDTAGHLLEKQDPRLSIASQVTVFALSGQPLKVKSVDAGMSVVLPGQSGEELQRWNARGNHWLTTYDNHLRPLTVEQNGAPDIEARKGHWVGLGGQGPVCRAGHKGDSRDTRYS
jgi:insecticidal toxin complex protein TccC